LGNTKTVDLCLLERGYSVAFQNNVSIGSAIPKGIDAGTARAAARSVPINLSSRDCDLPLLEEDVGIWVLKEHIWWNLALFDRKCSLYDTSKAGSTYGRCD